MIAAYRRVPIDHPKCKNCLHYLALRVACEVGQQPVICGDGAQPDVGYAPVSDTKLYVIGLPEAASAHPDPAVAPIAPMIDPAEVQALAGVEGAGPALHAAPRADGVIGDGATEMEPVSAPTSDDAIDAALHEVFEQFGPTDLNVRVGVVAGGVGRPGNGSVLAKSMQDDVAVLRHEAGNLLARIKHGSLKKSTCYQCEYNDRSLVRCDHRYTVEEFAGLVRTQVSGRIAKGYSTAMLDDVFRRHFGSDVYGALLKSAESQPLRDRARLAATKRTTSRGKKGFKISAAGPRPLTGDN